MEITSYQVLNAPNLAKSIKLHLYWAMKNCGGDGNVLKDMVDNIVNHYIVSVCSFITDYLSSIISKGDHSGCFHNSPCHTPAYSPSKVPLKDPRAAAALLAKLQDTYIYRQAGSFSRGSQTSWPAR